VELSRLQDQLKTALSGPSPETGTQSPPTATDLAGQIKLLKDAQSIEPMPQRTGGRRATSAEEPVTTRIRQRNGSLPALQPETEPGMPASQAEPSLPIPSDATEVPTPREIAPPLAGTALVYPASPKTAHLERLTRDRRQRDRQLSLF
jgi:hypothetical protein